MAGSTVEVKFGGKVLEAGVAEAGPLAFIALDGRRSETTRDGLRTLGRMLIELADSDGPDLLGNAARASVPLRSSRRK